MLGKAYLELRHSLICLLELFVTRPIVIYQILSIFVQLLRRGALLHHKQITLHLVVVSNYIVLRISIHLNNAYTVVDVRFNLNKRNLLLVDFMSFDFYFLPFLYLFDEANRFDLKCFLLRDLISQPWWLLILLLFGLLVWLGELCNQLWVTQLLLDLGDVDILVLLVIRLQPLLNRLYNPHEAWHTSILHNRCAKSLVLLPLILLECFLNLFVFLFLTKCFNNVGDLVEHTDR
jgi:hypothetical protein